MSAQDLEKALAVLRQQDRGVEAPAHVEAALRHALRARAAASRRRQTGWYLAVAAAIAVLLGGAWYGRIMWRDVAYSARPATARATSVTPLGTGRLEPSSPRPAPASSPVKKARKPRRAAPRPLPPVQEEVATDFLPLDDTLTLPPIESAQVLRVKVPSSTLVRFGVPVNQDRMMEPIRADVLFAQDGIARAIRFVK